MSRLINALSIIFEENNSRRKRETEDTIFMDEMCASLKPLWHKFGELKNGPIISLAKIEVAQMFDEEILDKFACKVCCQNNSS